jgi:methyltransferase (TIGR00027 family)
MREGRPSATAERVAQRRAAHQLLDQPPVFEDPLALRMLDPQAAAALAADPQRFESGRISPYLRAFLAARSRYAEDRLAVAVEAGARQYVVLGAGLDTFAYRNPHGAAGLRVFEVDHPATQAWKRVRLEQAGIAIPASLTFVALDFETRTLAAALQEAGFRAETRSFVSWLGVTMYLEADAVLATLASLATLMCMGSEVVFDYAIARSSLGMLQRAVFDALAARVAAVGEPWRSAFTPEALARELRGRGYAEALDLGPDELNARYFSGRRDGLRVGTLAHLLRARVGPE